MSTYDACFFVYAVGSRNFIFKTVTETVFYCMLRYDHFNCYFGKNTQMNYIILTTVLWLKYIIVQKLKNISKSHVHIFNAFKEQRPKKGVLIQHGCSEYCCSLSAKL